jgi:hypothetical protein
MANKKSRKAVVTTAAAIMAASAVTPVAAFAAETSFSDVPSNAYYADAVKTLVSKGVLSGYPDGTFKPTQNVKRAEAAKILTVARGWNTNATKSYPDVAASHWAYGYIAAASNAGAFGGDENGNFNPEANLTRAQAAKIIVEAYGLTGSSDLSFKDAANIQSWAVSYIKTAVANGILKGDDNGNVNPNASITRADFAVMIQRAEDATAAPKVVSVSAINAKKIEVKFNKEVAESDAENPSKYTFVGLGTTTATPELQADGKTVILTLSAPIANDTTFVVTVDEIATKASATAKTEKFTKTLTFSDKVAPALANVTYPRSGVAELNFTEELSTKGTVKVYEGTAESTDVSVGNLTAGDKKIVLTGLKANKEYKVVVVGAKDQSGNLLASPIEVVVKNTISDSVAPQVASLTTVGLDTVKVQFTEGLDEISTGVYANLYLDGSTTAEAGTTQSFDAATNTLTITKTGLVSGDGVHSVKIGGYVDLAGNAGTDYVKTVAFSNAAPAIKKTEVVKQGTDTFFVVTFDKAPNLTALKGTGYTVSYLTPDNIQKSTTIAANDITLDTTDASAPKALFKVTGKEAGVYTLVIPKANITDDVTPASADATLTFTLNATADVSKPNVLNVFLPGSNASSVVSGVTSVPLNTVYVKFDKPMSASALNAANYTVDGVTVFENPVFVGDKTVVKLTLKQNAITISGERNFAISSAVTAENNVAIDRYTNVLDFKENVKPVLSSAKLLSADEIELTFSEAIKDSSLTKADFTVTVDGATVALDDATITAWVTSGTADDNKVVLNLKTPLTVDQFGKAITVKLGENSTLTDIVGNAAVSNVTVNVAK